MLLIHVIRSLPMMREGRAVLLSSVSEGLLEAFSGRDASAWSLKVAETLSEVRQKTSVLSILCAQGTIWSFLTLFS